MEGDHHIKGGNRRIRRNLIGKAVVFRGIGGNGDFPVGTHKSAADLSVGINRHRRRSRRFLTAAAGAEPKERHAAQQSRK